MKFRKIRLPLFLAALGLAGWLGYRDESISRGAAGETRLPLQTKVRRIFAPKPDAFQSLDRLRSRAGHGSLSPDETAACWKIIRELNVAQIKRYLAEMPADPKRNANLHLATLLYQRWTQLDPEEAVTEIARSESTNWLLFPYFHDWIRKDPAAAIAMVNRLDPKSQTGQQVGQYIGFYLAETDPATAMEKARAISPMAVLGVTSYLTSHPSDEGNSPSARLSAAWQADAENSGRSMASYVVISDCSQRDPEGLLAAMDHMEIPEDRSASIRFQILQKVGEVRPELALDWTLRQHDSGVLSEPDLSAIRASVYRSYVTKSPAEAADWALRNRKPELISQSLGPAIVTGLRQSFYSNADEPSTGLQVQFQAWRQMEPEAAAAWAAQLPSDIRKNLTTATDAAR